VIEVFLVHGVDMPSGCDYNEAEGAYELPRFGSGSANTHQFTFPAPPCNGSFGGRVAGRARVPDGRVLAEVDNLYWPLVVEVPAPPVTELGSRTKDDRSVELTWKAPKWGKYGEALDFKGYRVYSTPPGGASHVICETASTTCTDKETQSRVGLPRYRVVALRSGADPSDVIESTGVEISASALNTTTTTSSPSTTPPPTGDGGGGGGGIGGIGGIGGGGGGGGGTGVRPTTTATIGVIDTDETYEGDEFEDGEPGDTEASIPSDEFASGVIDRRADEEPLDRRAVLVPVGAGACLLVWSLHLRYLTRLAAAGTTVVRRRRDEWTV
jgi:hypothetical protein